MRPVRAQPGASGYGQRADLDVIATLGQLQAAGANAKECPESELPTNHEKKTIPLSKKNYEVHEQNSTSRTFHVRNRIPWGIKTNPL